MAVPYHFHHQNEELFLIIEREATLRQNDCKRIVKKGGLLFFTNGPEGAHQLYNHTDKPVKYFDLITQREGDVCEYPDSDKVNCGEVYQKKDQVDYFTGEEMPAPFWNELLGKN